MAHRDPLLERARLDSQLKLGPQGTVLRQLLSDAAAAYTRTRKVNSSNEVGIKAATQEARPDVSAAFDQALSSVSAQRAALGASNDPQASAYTRRVSEQRANALNDLTQREVRATEGRVYANQSARDEYLGGKQKIQGQMLDLAQQQGALTASTLAQLKDEQRKRSLENRRIGVTEDSLAERKRHDQAQEATAQARARQQAKAKTGVKWATPQQHAKARSDIEQAVSYVNQLKGHITSRAKLIQTLTQGVPAGKDDDGSVLPAIPKFAPDYVKAAVNLVFDGDLSRADLQRLHNQGLQLHRLGYKVRPPQGPKPKHGVSAALGDLARGGASARLNPVK